MANGLARSQDEILDRLYNLDSHTDWLGHPAYVLLGFLEPENYHSYTGRELLDGMFRPKGETADVVVEAASYLVFTFDKIENHRGFSNSRSADKLREYAWLMGRDDIVATMSAAPHTNYGAAKVKAFAEGMAGSWGKRAKFAGDDLSWPDSDALNNMAYGKQCEPGCCQGCEAPEPSFPVGMVIPVDDNCPDCGYPERRATTDKHGIVFTCHNCPHVSRG